MPKIPFIQDLYEKSKEHNVFSGIIIFDLIAFIAYLINPISFFFLGDLHVLFGAIVGVILALKARKVGDNPIHIGLIVGFFGAFLSAISIIIFHFFVFVLPKPGFDLYLTLSLFFEIFIVATIIGIMIGGMMGLYISHKERENKNKHRDLNRNSYKY